MQDRLQFENFSTLVTHEQSVVCFDTGTLSPAEMVDRINNNALELIPIPRVTGKRDFDKTYNEMVTAANILFFDCGKVTIAVFDKYDGVVVATYWHVTLMPRRSNHLMN